MNFSKRGRLTTEELVENLSSEEAIRMIREAKIRRNTYLGLFAVGFACIIVTALLNEMTLCILSLFLATVSLVVMTKYDTYLFFLKILKETNERKNLTPDHS
jgi:uncharacterized membrane protein YjjP (DUF1212 family)